MKMPLMILLITLTAAMALAGCGGGARPVRVTVDLTEFAFDPDGIKAPAGAEVAVTLDNQGTLDHNFLVMNQGVDLTEFTNADEASVYFEQLQLPAGESTVVTFTAPSEPGVYQFLCSIPGHLTLGMQGTLTVSAP